MSICILKIFNALNELKYDDNRPITCVVPVLFAQHQRSGVALLYKSHYKAQSTLQFRVFSPYITVSRQLQRLLVLTFREHQLPRHIPPIFQYSKLYKDYTVFTYSHLTVLI